MRFQRYSNNYIGTIGYKADGNRPKWVLNVFQNMQYILIAKEHKVYKLKFLETWFKMIVVLK